jgi:NAD(P)-dependent dehydrogenase (short-subunit alcohol dehydrogenase family)
MMKQTGMSRKKAQEKQITLQSLNSNKMLKNCSTRYPQPTPEIIEECFNNVQEPMQLHQPRKCQQCSQRYDQLHHFYDKLCPKCAELNYSKRTQTGDCSGKVALVTGGRIKIGYQIALTLLRNHCELVIVTTRFPKDCALRFSQEPDFSTFKNRLKIYGLDLRHIPSVLEFTQFLNNTLPRLDILINNAAQTIRRPTIYYNHVVSKELTNSLEDIPTDVRNILGDGFTMRLDHVQQMLGIENTEKRHDSIIPVNVQSTLSVIQNSGSSSSILSIIPVDEEDHKYKNDTSMFPPGSVDVNNEQVDLRPRTTWTKKLDEISPIEMIEVQTVNSTAPFLFCGNLRSLMSREKEQPKWIINVSSMEGQFYKKFKTSCHPHTNMSKAALNMMTRTSGIDFVRDNIFMNAVDTGWVTDENPNSQQREQTAPLDEIDGAMRVLDPVSWLLKFFLKLKIFVGINTGVNKHSLFYKNYESVLW